VRLRVAKVGRNHLHEEITPLLLNPTGIGERYSQTMSNLGHAALLPNNFIRYFENYLLAPVLFT
jgi:hypothetical protein